MQQLACIGRWSTREVSGLHVEPVGADNWPPPFQFDTVHELEPSTEERQRGLRTRV